MKKFRKVWSEELNAWILTTKGMKPDDAYALFLKTFPEITDVTRTAFMNQRSRVGAAGECKNPNFARQKRGLWSEQVKKGYVRIKIAMPNVWVSKSKWVYMETHPWEDFSERSNFVFLDGDTRNFHPDNIERVPIRIMAQFCLLGGCEKGQPEVTRLRILLAKLKMARLDAGEKLGLVVDGGNGRVFREERNRRSREYQKKRREDPAVGEILREQRKRYWERLKNDPIKYEQVKARHKSYLKEYKRRNEK